MKSWETKSGVLRIEDRQTWFDALGVMLFGTLFGGIFGGAGVCFFAAAVSCLLGHGGNMSAPGTFAAILFSLLPIGVGGWLLWETFVPVRLIEVRHMNHSWEIMERRLFRLFPGIGFTTLKLADGMPNWTEIRGGTKTTWYEYRVLLGGTRVVDFEYRITAEAVTEALRDLAKDTGPWTA